jgi:hypothetical protein
MGQGRTVRFALEVALLVALAVALGLAEVRPAAIVAAMALAWLIVALVEWVALRDLPHYGSGSPPRYELPYAPLPPPRPVEQVAPYPTAREIDAPTWIASPSQVEAGIDDWPVPVAAQPEPSIPVAVGTDAPADGVDEVEAKAAEPAFSPPGAASDPWYVQELPAEPLAGAPQARTALHRVDPLVRPAGRRFLRRRRDEPSGPIVEFPVLPRHAPLQARGR